MLQQDLHVDIHQKQDDFYICGNEINLQLQVIWTFLERTALFLPGIFNEHGDESDLFLEAERRTKVSIDVEEYVWLG